MHRKSIKALIERINGSPLPSKQKSLEERIDLDWLKDYLFACNPTAKELKKELNVSSSVLFKFTKSVNYKFLTYRERQKLNLEYNSSKSVQQPK